MASNSLQWLLIAYIAIFNMACYNGNGPRLQWSAEVLECLAKVYNGLQLLTMAYNVFVAMTLTLFCGF